MFRIDDPKTMSFYLTQSRSESWQYLLSILQPVLLSYSVEIWVCWGWSPASCLGWLATMQLLATLSNSFWISGAQCTNSWDQNLKVGFLISSMKVMRRPQGCGLLTISLSSKTLKRVCKVLNLILWRDDWMNDWFRECYGIRATEAVSGYICKMLSGLYLVICSWMSSLLASANK